MRDIFKIAEETTVKDRYQLTVGEIIALLNTMPFLKYFAGATDTAYDTLSIAFNYGYAMGIRCERNRAKRARK